MGLEKGALNGAKEADQKSILAVLELTAKPVANLILSSEDVNEINYISRVKIPTLMLNGRYDMTFPYELSVKPMFDLLGTPSGQKELKLYDTDHFIPRNEFIKETLRWLDKYLGPVK